MAPSLVKPSDTCLQKSEKGLAAATIHLKELIRVMNGLRSPLLRLPTETIIHILSYIMGSAGLPSAWRWIVRTCHRIHKIMCTSTQLWRTADFSSVRLAQVAFERSQGNIGMITAYVHVKDRQGNEHALNAWRFCRDNMALQGGRLHTLELCGYPSHLADFLWIFERPLPRLERLEIRFIPSPYNSTSPPQLGPVALQLPSDLPLRVLHLSGAILPWSSRLYTGLSELHLDFESCNAAVEVSKQDISRLLEASPQLESLFLRRIRLKTDEEQYNPTQIVTFASLKSLVLAIELSASVRHLLDHLDTPAVEYLDIQADFSSWEVDHFIEYLCSGCRLPDRLFSKPPKFEFRPCYEDDRDALKVSMGRCYVQFDFGAYSDEFEEILGAMLTHILPLVPSSVTTLSLEHSNLNEDDGWTDFFSSHPEVRSIELWHEALVGESLWDALSPTEADGVTLCTRLESIDLTDWAETTPLFNCLLKRKAAGFGLKRLQLYEAGEMMAETLSSVVEELQVFHRPARPTQWWGCGCSPRSHSRDEPSI
ncbi:hypothetical protein BJ322DRAFT_519980 [Thelephora terrestris]|uniref:F-box domain-containing protein n=1 Tax=Thelephora terrestris TaxID=56493 RepID=A0A9P6L0C5_9AGAM|nr:hypothetical protein BJ322DRAFT_519980 [Thelephora terrestris]